MRAAVPACCAGPASTARAQDRRRGAPPARARRSRQRADAGSLALPQRIGDRARSPPTRSCSLDEPAAAPGGREELAALLRALRDDGVTILVVEHDMEFVMQLVDRLVVMDFGAKLVEGAPAAVRADARVQAAYLGAAA
jgi:branched-chain amino acid transport system permease protein